DVVEDELVALGAGDHRAAPERLADDAGGVGGDEDDGAARRLVAVEEDGAAAEQVHRVTEAARLLAAADGVAAVDCGPGLDGGGEDVGASATLGEPGGHEEVVLGDGAEEGDAGLVAAEDAKLDQSGD